MILKKVAGVFFAVAFLMAIVLFTGTGRSFVPTSIAKTIFIVSGGIGLLLNLFSFQSGKGSSIFNFFYWVGSIVLFIGLVFLLMRWPYGFYIIVTGLAIVGISFFIPDNISISEQKRNDILDDEN